jgi:CubicO group peptidase (beta-lactamase class C family)
MHPSTNQQQPRMNLPYRIPPFCRSGRRPSRLAAAPFLTVLALTAALLAPTALLAQAWESWPSPEDGGLSSAGLAQVEARLGEMSTSAMMIVSGGKVAFAHGDLAEVSYLASVRKTVLALLYGIEVERGRIDLDRTLAEMGLEEHGGLTAAESRARVRDVIAARSGIHLPASNSGDDLASAPERGSVAPGSYYLYSNWDFNAAGTLFELETGRDLFDALEADLARPLGFEDFDRARHVKGGNLEVSMHPSYHMHFSTRDMARLGELMLRNGSWHGESVVPAAWIAEMTSPLTPVSEMNPPHRRDGPHGYGYMTWVWDGEAATGPYAGAFTGVGAVGQYITVLPALDMVVAHKTVPGVGRRVNHPEFWELLELVVEAHCGAACPQP